MQLINPDMVFAAMAAIMAAVVLGYALLCWLECRRNGWQGTGSLLWPGQRMMQGMSLIQKFLLIGMLAMAPAILAFSQVLAANSHELKHIGSERVGVRHIQKMMPLLEALAQHRGMTHVSLLGNHAYDKSIGLKRQEIEALFKRQSLLADIPGIAAVYQHWQAYQGVHLGLGIEEQWKRQTKIIDGLLAVIRETGKKYALSFDSHPGRHYLMSVFLEHLPQALGSAGQIRGLGSGIVAGAELSEEQHFQLAGFSARLRQSSLDIGSDLKQAYYYNESLGQELAEQFGSYRTNIENMLFVLEHNLLHSRSFNTLYFINNQLSTSQKDFFSLATRVITSGMLLSASSIEAFSRGLDARSSHLAAMEKVLYSAFFFCLALVVWLFYLFYSSTRNTVTSLQQLATELRRGNVDHGITARGRDEIAAMVNVFDDIAGTLVRTIELRNKSEQKLLNLSRAVEQTAEGVLITDRDGTVEYANRAYGRMFGFAGEEMIGKPIYPGAGATEDNSFSYALSEVIAAGGTWQGETLAEGKAGHSIPIYCALNPICDSNGEVDHFVITYRDMSERKQIEEKMMLSQKMESIGTLAGGIAHDFNNALQGISGHLYLADRNGSHSPKAQAHITQAQKLVDKSSAMVRQLMTFARHETGKKETIEFTPFLKEAIELSRVSIPANIELDVRLSDDANRIVGDTTQLQQIIMNLLNNARDAVMDTTGPVISLRSETIFAGKEFLRNHPKIRPGRYIRLSISDNGCGIAEADIKRIFEPFFTTKSAGQGTGLGLAMVFSCMQSHEGAIDVASKPGEGTTFKLYFRVDENGIDRATLEDKQGVVRGRQETILLVDDEATVRDTGREVLENLGYRVLVAEDGYAAVGLYTAFQHEIDLVILDLVMPRMGGVEAARHIKIVRGDANICFATGYDLDGSICRDLPCSSRDVINKPFSVYEFSHFVREKLERPSKPSFGSRIFDSALKLRRSG